MAYRIKTFIAIVAAIGTLTVCHADNGILYYDGTPRLMRGGAKIEMVQEFVRIKVGKTHAKVYCRFVCRNTGRSIQARIGFPDGSDLDDDTEFETKPALRHFRSVIDGIPIPTRVEKTDRLKTPYRFFHVKTVNFASHQTRVIEDWYSAPLDEFGTRTLGKNFNWYARGLGYIMASGGSWKGNIGKATIQIEFQPRRLRNPHPVPFTEISRPEEVANWDQIPGNHIFWKGFAKPIHRGNSLIFRRKNFKPEPSSDIWLVFGAFPNP